MLCFCPNVKNEEELLELLRHGKWDREIFEYLKEIMSEKEDNVLNYEPVELFEMQANMSEQNEMLYFQFWNINESGIYKNFRFTLNKKQREFFDLFVTRIREIYASLQELVLVSGSRKMNNKLLFHICTGLNNTPGPWELDDVAESHITGTVTIPRDKRLEMILKSVESINLSDEERKFLAWISEWDTDITNNFISIVEKIKSN